MLLTNVPFTVSEIVSGLSRCKAGGINGKTKRATSANLVTINMIAIKPAISFL